MSIASSPMSRAVQIMAGDWAVLFLNTTGRLQQCRWWSDGVLMHAHGYQVVTKLLVRVDSSNYIIAFCRFCKQLAVNFPWSSHNLLSRHAIFWLFTLSMILSNEHWRGKIAWQAKRMRDECGILTASSPYFFFWISHEISRGHCSLLRFSFITRRIRSRSLVNC